MEICQLGCLSVYLYVLSKHVAFFLPHLLLSTHHKIRMWYGVMFQIVKRKRSYEIFDCLKVSKFQNEFFKSSFLPKYEPNIARISDLYYATLQGRNPYNFWFIFWEKWWLHNFILKFTDSEQMWSKNVHVFHRFM